MQFLFDNLVAVAVGAVLIGILAMLGLRQQSESAMLAEHHLAAGREAALSDWLQSDLQSLTAVTSRTATQLVFSRTMDPAATLTNSVEYTLVCPTATPTRCRVVRREAGVDRTVSPVVASFDVTLLTAAGLSTTTPALAAALKVRVVTSPGLTSGGDASVWERTFTPRMLGRTTV